MSARRSGLHGRTLGEQNPHNKASGHRRREAGARKNPSTTHDVQLRQKHREDGCETLPGRAWSGYSACESGLGRKTASASAPCQWHLPAAYPRQEPQQTSGSHTWLMANRRWEGKYKQGCRQRPLKTPRPREGRVAIKTKNRQQTLLPRQSLWTPVADQLPLQGMVGSNEDVQKNKTAGYDDGTRAAPCSHTILADATPQRLREY